VSKIWDRKKKKAKTLIGAQGQVFFSFLLFIRAGYFTYILSHLNVNFFEKRTEPGFIL
jgi:hypothetical protein